MRRRRLVFGAMVLASAVLLGVALDGSGTSEATPTPTPAVTTKRAKPDADTVAARRRRALARLATHVEGASRALAVTVVDCRGAAAGGAAGTVIGADGAALANGQADASGAFTARVPEADAVSVVASLGPHEGGAAPSRDSAVRVDVCPGASVEGRVVDRRGRPVVDATVTLGDGVDVAVTDEAGEFVLTDVDLTGDRIVATAEAASGELALTRLDPFEVRRVELVLETGRRLLGVVLDPAGEPVPYATLTAKDFADQEVARARSDRLGRFWLKEVPFTPVMIVADDGQGGVGQLYVEADAVRDDLVVTLQPAGRLMVDYQGPYTDAFDVIALVDGLGDRPGKVTMLRGPGDVVVLPAPRKYWVVYGEDHTPCGEVLLTPGQVATVRCGAPREGRIVGRVVDAGGRPLANVGVWLRAPDGIADVRTTDGGGRFVFALATARTLPADVIVQVRGRDYLPTRRRNVPLAPGETTDLGDLRLDAAEDFPGLRSGDPFGGIGAQIETTEDGIRLGRIVRGGPLDVAGVEAGEVVIAIGEAASGFLPALDAVRLLRGAPGSAITLRLRKADGSTREVNVERSVIDVESAGWVN